MRYATVHPAVLLRWPLQQLQQLQPLQKTQLQPPFGPSVDSLCHPWVTKTNLSYRLPIFETSATALCGTTGANCTWLEWSSEDLERVKASWKCNSILAGPSAQIYLLIPWDVCQPAGPRDSAEDATLIPPRWASWVKSEKKALCFFKDWDWDLKQLFYCCKWPLFGDPSAFSRMRSKGSHFTLGAWGLRVCSLDVVQPFATDRSHLQPSAIVHARPVWPCLWRVLQKGSLLEVSNVV